MSTLKTVIKINIFLQTIFICKTDISVLNMPNIFVSVVTKDGGKYLCTKQNVKRGHLIVKLITKKGQCFLKKKTSKGPNF